jgi:hypothetical protein
MSNESRGGPGLLDLEKELTCSVCTLHNHAASCVIRSDLIDERDIHEDHNVNPPFFDHRPPLVVDNHIALDR